MPDRLPAPRTVFRVVLLAALVWSLSLADQVVPQALARIPVFQARDHEFVGLRYLTSEAVLRTAGLGFDASLWDDPSEWEARLERHPLVREAHVRRRFPSTLVVEIAEREPVGLVPTPTLEPVDAEGRYLPLDPTRFRLDYPILYPAEAAGAEDTPPAVRVRPLAGVSAQLRNEPEFWRQISEISAGEHNDVTLRWGDERIRFRLPEYVEMSRVRDALLALNDAGERSGGRLPETVDLRFADWIILDWGREGRP
jgi:cell division septal protein FtsQ